MTWVCVGLTVSLAGIILAIIFTRKPVPARPVKPEKGEACAVCHKPITGRRHTLRVYGPEGKLAVKRVLCSHACVAKYRMLYKNPQFYAIEVISIVL